MKPQKQSPQGLNKTMKTKISREQVAFKPSVALRKSVAAMTAFTMIAQPVCAFASEIVAGGAFVPNITLTNGVHEINSNYTNGNNAFNSFNKFDLDKNHIANMNFGSAGNLFNFVNSRINVNGTINAVKNGKIGGNLYFLSKEGMVVGAHGVINTGSLYIMTPSADTINSIFGGSGFTDQEKTNLASNIAGGLLPVNPSGTIIVRGQINAVNDITLRANTIKIGEYYMQDETASADGTPATILKTGVTDFSSLVNTNGKFGVEGNSGLSGNLIAVADPQSGNILLRAEATGSENNIPVNSAIAIGKSALLDTTNAQQGNIIIEATATHAHIAKAGDEEKIVELDLINDSNLVFDYEAVQSISSSSALVQIDGDIHAKGNLDITANSSASGKTEADAAKNGTVYVKADSDATVGVGGKLSANGNLNIEANASTIIDGQIAVKSNENTVDNSELAFAAVVAEGSTKAKVNIRSGASVVAKDGNLNIGSKATSSIHTLANAEAAKNKNTGDESYGAVAFNLTTFDSDAQTIIDGNLNTINSGDISVSARNELVDNTIIADTGAKVGNKGAKASNKDKVINSGITGKLSNIAQKKNTAESAQMSQNGNDNPIFTAAGALVMADETHRSGVTVNGNINSVDNLTVKSETIIGDTLIQANADSKVYPNQDSSALSAAILVGNMENSSSVVIGENAVLSGKTNSISSSTKMDYQRFQNFVKQLTTLKDTLKNAPNITIDWNAFESALSELSEEFKSLEIDGILSDKGLEKLQKIVDATGGLGTGLQDAMDSPMEEVAKAATALTNIVEYSTLSNFANFSARSSAKGSADSNLAGAGSLSISSVDSSSFVQIGRGAQITARAGDLSVQANNKSEVVNFGGNTKGLMGPVGVQAKDGVSLGGTYTQQNFDNNAVILIAEGVRLSGDNVFIQANNDLFNVAAALGAGKGKYTLNGMASYSHGESNTLVSIDDEARIEAKDNINIHALNDTKVTNVAGAFASSQGGAAIGMSAAVNNYKVNNQALIGDNDFLFGGSQYSGQGKISGANFNLSTETTGLINAISVAGALTTSEQNSSGGSDSGNTNLLSKVKGLAGKAGALNNKINGNNGGYLGAVTDYFTGNGGNDSKVTGAMNQGGAEQGGGGVANSTSSDVGFTLNGAGSASVNLIDNHTVASVNGTSIELTGNGDKKVNVLARDEAWNGAWSGAAGVSWQKGKGTSVGFVGAVALNDIQNTTKASIENTNIKNAGQINTLALSGGEQIAAGLGLQVTKSGGQSYTGGASVSVNLIDRTVDAGMKNNLVEGSASKKTDITVAAYESDVQVTGGAQVSVGNQDVGIGGAVAVASIKNTVNSEISGGIYKDVGDVRVDALLATTQVNAAIAMGISTDSKAKVFSGAVVYNKLDNHVTGKITRAEIDSSGVVAVRARDVRSGSTTATEYQDLLKDRQSLQDYGSSRGISQDGKEYYQNVDTSIGKADDRQIDTDENITNLNQDRDGAIIITAALAGAGSGQVAGGAAVAIDDIDNRFTAQIDHSTINARIVETEAQADTLLVGVAGGAAISGKFSGMGTVSWQNIDNKVNSGITNQSKITADSVNAIAQNQALMVNVAGQLTVGGKGAVGASLGYNKLNNDTHAYINSSEISALNDKVNIGVIADNNAHLVDIVVSGAASGSVAVTGAVAINRTENETTAVIDGANISDAEKITVNAKDTGKIDSVAGALTGAGKVAVGGAVAYNEVGSHSNDQKVTAVIKNSSITTKGQAEITVTAEHDARIRAIAAALGGSGTVAVQGAATTNLIRKNTSAFMDNVKIDENNMAGNAKVDVASKSKGTIESIAIGLSGSGTVAIGAGVAVNDITETTTAKVSSGEQNVQNLLVKSTAGAEIKTIGVAGSGSGTVAASGSVAVNNITNNNQAIIDKGANIVADGSVGVVAQTDNFIANYAGVLAVSGAAGFGVATSVNQIDGQTKASIEGSTTHVTANGNDNGIEVAGIIGDADIFDKVIEGDTLTINNSLKNKRQTENKTGVVVDASATNTMKSVLISAIGGQVAIGGTVNVNIIDGKTLAQIDQATINSASRYGNISVRSADYSNSSGFVGTVGVSAYTTVGASSDTAVVNRSSEAAIIGKNGFEKDIYAKSLTVEADAKQGISSLGAGVAIAGFGGAVAGTVGVVKLNGHTKASLQNINGQVDSLAVDANHLGRVNQGIGSLGAGVFAGVGAAVGVVLEESKTEAAVSNTNIDMRNNGSVAIKAKNETKVSTWSASAGVGLVGLSGAIQVNNLNSTVKAGLENSTIGSETNRAGNTNIEAINQVNLNSHLGNFAAGAVGVGAGVTVNTIDNQVQTTIAGSKVFSAGDIKINAEENRTINQKAGNATAGIAAVGANVMVTTVGKNATSHNSNDASISEAIQKANEANNKNGTERYALGAKGQVAAANNAGQVTAGSGKENGSSIGIQVQNSTMDTTGKLDINAKENAKTTMHGGSVAVGGLAANGSVGILDVNRKIAINLDHANLVGNNGVNIGSNIYGNNELNVYQGTVGAIALGAAYGQVKVNGTSQITISNNSMIKTDDRLAIHSNDNSTVDVNAYGITGGLIAAGAVIAKGENASASAIDVKDNNKLSADIIDLEAKKANTVTVIAKGGAAGFATGLGVVADAKDSGVAKVTVGTNNQFTGKNIALRALNNPAVKAVTDIVDVSAVGVSVTSAEAKASAKALVNVGNHNIFDGEQVKFEAKINKNNGKNTAESWGVGTSVGIIANISFNEAKATSNTEANVNVGANSYSDKTNLVVNADSNTSQQAKMKANGGGFVAVGGVKTRTEATNKTVAMVAGLAGSEASQVKNLSVSATGKTTNTVEASASKSGFVADTTSTYAESIINTETNSTLMGNWNVEEAVTINSEQTNEARLYAEAGASGFVGNTGVTAASILTTNTETKILNGIIKSKTIDATAKNDITVGSTKGDGNNDNILESSGKGFIGLSENASANIVKSTAKVSIGETGKPVQIYTDGTQSYKAFTRANVNFSVESRSSGFIASTGAYNHSDFDFLNQVSLGEASKLANHDPKVNNNNILLSANDDLNIRLKADSNNSVSAGGSVTSSVKADWNRANRVDVAGHIFSMEKVSLLAGNESKLSLDLYAYARNKSFIPKISSSVGITGGQGNVVLVKAGALVESVEDINIEAETVKNTEKISQIAKRKVWYKKEKTDDKGNVIKDDDGNTVYDDVEGDDSNGNSGDTNARSNQVTINGDLIAGARAKYNIILGQPGAKEPVNLQNGDKPLLSINDVMVSDEETAGIEYITDVNGDQIIKLPDLIAKSGNIFIQTDKLLGGGSMTAHSASELSVTNNTNMALDLQNVKVSNKAGGKITLNDNNVSNPHGGITVTSNTTLGGGGINIVSNWDSPLGGARPNTNINIQGMVQNANGDVNIHSKQGNINAKAIESGKNLSIIADRGAVTIEAGNGNFISVNPVLVVASGDISINAKNLSANGLIQSGIADYSALLSENLVSVQIGNLEQNYAGQTLSDEDIMRNDEFKLNTGGLVKNANGEYEFVVQAYYNPTTKQIIFEDIVSEGGKVTLTAGNITGSGKILALDGAARVKLDSQVKGNIALGKIELSDRQGQVNINGSAFESIGSPHNANGKTIDFIGYGKGNISVNGQNDVRLNDNIINAKQATSTGNSVTSIIAGNGRIDQFGGKLISDSLILKSTTGQNLQNQNNEVQFLQTQNTGRGDILFYNAGQNGLELTFTNSDVDGKVNVTNEKGTFTVTNALNATEQIVFKNTEGDLTSMGALTSGENIALITSKGNILNQGALNAQDSIFISTGKGTILNDSSITAGSGITIVSAEGAITNNGKLLAKDKDILLETTIGAITNKDDIIAENGHIIMRNTQGNILNKGSLWARDNISLHAGNGNIISHKLDGEQVIIEVGKESNKVRIGEVVIGQLLKITADDMKADYVAQRAHRENMVTFSFRSVGNQKPIHSVVFPMVDIPNGVIVDQLWADQALIHVNSEKFYLPKLKITEYGYFSNIHTQAKVYGDSPWRDNSQDDIFWNNANPSASWIDLYFYGGRHVTSNGVLLINRDYYKVYNQRYSAVNEAGIVNRYSDASPAFWWRMADFNVSYLDNRLTDYLVWSEDDSIFGKSEKTNEISVIP